MNHWLNQCHFGDCLETLRLMPAGIVNTCVTSPPYFGLRSYLPDGHADKHLEIGLDNTPEKYIARLVDVFREVRRVLRDDGILWINIGDSYSVQHIGRRDHGTSSPTSRLGPNKDGIPFGTEIKATGNRLISGLKPKDLIGIPWLLAFALRADGWYLRQEIIWHKQNPMPESVTDRCTKSHEYIFLLSKSERYFFDSEAMQEPANRPEGPGNKTHRHANQGIYVNGASQKNIAKIGPRETRNRRSVWTVATTPYKGAHFATFPPALIEPCILAGAPAGGVVLDPFGGSGTTAQTAQNLGRKWILCELNEAYKPLIDERVAQPSLEFA